MNMFEEKEVTITVTRKDEICDVLMDIAEQLGLTPIESRVTTGAKACACKAYVEVDPKTVAGGAAYSHLYLQFNNCQPLYNLMGWGSLPKNQQQFGATCIIV